MTLLMGLVISALGGAIAWRGRGGPFGLPSTQLTRVLCVVIMTAIAVAATGLIGLCMAAHMLVIWVGWADWQRMERPTDVLLMGARGLLQTLPTACALWYFGPNSAAYIYFAAGFLMGPIYWLANRYLANVRHVTIFGKEWIDGPCSLAELGVGAFMTGAFVAVAALR